MFKPYFTSSLDPHDLNMECLIVAIGLPDFEAHVMAEALNVVEEVQDS
jgi:hypothetical protein